MSLQSRVDAKNLLGTSIEFGNYSLKVQKVANKKVTIEEHLNGLRHNHSWCPINKVEEYVNFKTVLLRHLSNRESSNLLPSNSSPECKMQHESLLNAKFELFEYLNALLDSEKNMVFYDINGKNLDILFGSEKVITLMNRGFYDAPFIQYHKSNSTILDEGDAKIFIALGKITEELYEGSNLSRLLWTVYELGKQLKKFTKEEISIELDPNLDAEIRQFTQESDNGDIFYYKLPSVGGYERFFELRKKSRIKYVAEIVSVKSSRELTPEDIVNIPKEDKIFEYWTYYSKMSQNLTENINDFKQLIKTFS